MSTIQAWQYIVNNWHSPDWQPIPQEVKQILHLDSRLGMSGGMSVTRNGADRIAQFVNDMNKKRGKQ